MPNLKFSVIVEAPAIRDARDYADFILTESKNPVPAAKWLSELERAVSELSELPRRFRVIEEQPSFPIELRQFIFYSHRVIYHVNDESATVHVLRIYHAHRDALHAEAVDLP